MKKKIEVKDGNISTGYVPRPLQAELHSSLKRFNVVICHRRFGKTIFAINEMIDQGLRLYASRGKTDRPRPRFAYIAPTYGQAKKIAWDYIKSYTANLPGVSINEAELRVDISLFGDPNNTLRFQLLGAENPGSIKGIYLDGAILDEYAEMLPKTWTEAIRPTLSDRQGWAIFIGTPKGKNHFFDIFKYAEGADDWFARIFKASETGVINPEELADAKRTMPEDEYNQEYECSFDGSTIGAYYAEEMREVRSSGRIRLVPYDRSVLVNTAWDLGIDDEMSVWFYQRIFREIHIIDYFEGSGKGIPEMAGILLKEKPYVYGTHFFPHDGAARELGTGKTRQETAEALGLRPIVIARRDNVIDGINEVRKILPRCYFDENKAARGITCLEEYKKKFDEKAQTFLQSPVHNQYSHGADGFRTLAMTLDMDAGSRENLPEMAESYYNPMDDNRGRNRDRYTY